MVWHKKNFLVIGALGPRFAHRRFAETIENVCTGDDPIHERRDALVEFLAGSETIGFTASQTRSARWNHPQVSKKDKNEEKNKLFFLLLSRANGKKF